MPNRPGEDCVHVSLNAEDTELLNLGARKEGLSRTTFIRMLIRRYSMQNTLQTPSSNIEIPVVINEVKPS